jgi:hypothetical protein
MRVRNVLRRGLPLVLVFLLGASMVGSAWAAVTRIRGNLTVTGVVKAKNFRYLNPRANRLVVPGAAFVGNLSLGYTGSVYIEDTAVAPVNLPQGATVTRVVWFHQAGAAGEGHLHLESNNRTGGHSDMVIGDNVACATTPCATVFNTVSPNRINNNQRHYGIWLADNGDPGFETYSVIIHYRTADVGPRTSSLPTASWQGRPSTAHE